MIPLYTEFGKFATKNAKNVIINASYYQIMNQRINVSMTINAKENNLYAQSLNVTKKIVI